MHFDSYQRELYSTDASNHRLLPLGIVVPNSQDDLSLIAATAADLNVPILPRGAGTSLAGQAIGHAVIIDCGKNLNKLIHLDSEKQTAVVEPGVTCLQLNKAAAPHGLMFGPDPASADRATFGGMIGNNATGAHSIQYGMTADHLRRLWVTLADGSETVFEQLSAKKLASKAQEADLEGQIYRAAARVRREYAEALKSSWPRTWRRASGYSLNYLIGYSPSRPPAWPANKPYPDHDLSNLAPVLAGSEGTLALFRQAEVRLVPKPNAKVLVLISTDSIMEAVKRVPALLESRPAAVELIPRTLLARAATIPAYSRKLTFLERIPDALLAVEYAGESIQDARDRASAVSGEGILLDDTESQNNLWDVRKAGLGLLMSVPGGEKPITFIEDVAVPIDRLAEYVERVEHILGEHNTQAAWYAHASAGCLHLRPMINLRTQRGVDRMRSIAEQVAAVVLDLGGAMSGEHGDGLSHTEFNQLLFGPTAMQAFHEVKRAFDPQEILNPGKIVPSSRAVEPSLDKHLRFGGDYSTRDINTHFSHIREGGLAGEVEACVGLGVCRKQEGLMCPSFQATREEADVTRGRANALRAALAGQLPSGALTSEEMYRIYDLCLECKGCKAECPTGVDIARVKA
ncbi:MAG: FAD-linked oxidase C-terminal domain-containing protein, partial [Anaerolineales bacterium]